MDANLDFCPTLMKGALSVVTKSIYQVHAQRVNNTFCPPKIWKTQIQKPQPLVYPPTVQPIKFGTKTFVFPSKPVGNPPKLWSSMPKIFPPSVKKITWVSAAASLIQSISAKKIKSKIFVTNAWMSELPGMSEDQ